MKRLAVILIAAATSAHAQFAVMHTNGVVTSPTNLTIQQSNVSGLSNALATKLGTNGSAAALTNFPGNLLSHGANGQVIYTNTNPLTFTNRFRQSSDTATNPPEIRLLTKSNAVGSWFYYDAFGAGGANTTNDVDWAIMWLGNNHVASTTGLDFGKANQSIGAISLTMENMYYAGSLPSPNHVGEFYLNMSDYGTNGIGTTRAVFIVGSQTNSLRGQISAAYPVYINYNQEAVDWLGSGGGGGLNVSTTNSFLLATFYNTGTAHGGAARLQIGAPANAMGIEAGPNYGFIRQFSAGRTAFRISTNGVIYGTTNNSETAQSPVHLAGNTRIDGAITFDNTTNAATTRTNLGLGSGITTNVSSGTLQFSNGILVGHTP
jgi:hypothetical protein